MTGQVSDCLNCHAQSSAIPPEAQLRILTTEDWDPECFAFTPRAMTQEQAVAAELLTSSISRYWHACGVECLGARLNVLIMILRDRAKRTRIAQRTLRARTDINVRYRRALQAGPAASEMRQCSDLVWFEGAAYPRSFVSRLNEITDEPTPDYPGKAQDDQWLRGPK